MFGLTNKLQNICKTKKRTVYCGEPIAALLDNASMLNKEFKHLLASCFSRN